MAMALATNLNIIQIHLLQICVIICQLKDIFAQFMTDENVEVTLLPSKLKNSRRILLCSKMIFTFSQKKSCKTICLSCRDRQSAKCKK